MSIQDTISTGSVVSGLDGFSPLITVSFFILFLILNFTSLKHFKIKIQSLGRDIDTSKRLRYTFLYRLNLVVILINLMLLIHVAT